jgi:cytochrome c556
MGNNKLLKALRIGTAFALVSVSLSVLGESDPEDIIKYRQNVMKANGAHMAAIAAIIQGKVPYHDQLAEHVKAVQDINRYVHTLFPKGSDFGNTKARDAVWQKPDEFAKRAKDTQQKADALAKAVAAKDTKSYAPRFKELSESCKACHKDFRREENQ